MNKRDKKDFLYYDEMEWRIVHLDRLEKIEKKIKQDEKDNSVFRVILKPEDIRVIVFPDKETRDIAFSEIPLLGKMKTWILTTLDDCEHF